LYVEDFLNSLVEVLPFHASFFPLDYKIRIRLGRK